MSDERRELDPREPVIHAQYLAGRDSPHHSPESRAAWRRLYERDIERVGGKPMPEASDSPEKTT